MDEPNNEEIVVSLVVATIGRAQELSRLLASIDRQSLKRVELIIVDQNPDDRVEKLLEAWKATLSYRHVRSPKGLSRARNVGIKLASGPIICFPDDDCWYPDNLLEHVSKWFDRHRLMISSVAPRRMGAAGRLHHGGQATLSRSIAARFCAPAQARLCSCAEKR